MRVAFNLLYSQPGSREGQHGYLWLVQDYSLRGRQVEPRLSIIFTLTRLFFAFPFEIIVDAHACGRNNRDSPTMMPCGTRVQYPSQEGYTDTLHQP